MAMPAFLLLASCQSEPEVGSTLYPTKGEDYSPVAYIDNRAYIPKNFKSTTYIQKGSSDELEIPGDTLCFNVQLTAAADKDLTFNIKVDNSKIPAAAAEGHKPFEASSFKMETATVTVKKGTLQSQEPFKIALNGESKELLALTDSEAGITAFTIESPDGVKISDKYNTYSWELKKEVYWINPNGMIDNLAQIETSVYDVNCGGYGRIGLELSDGDNNTFANYRVSDISSQFMKIELKDLVDITAIQLTPCGRLWGDDLSRFFSKEIEILGSISAKSMNDVKAEEFSRLGFATCQNKPGGPEDKWNIVFYGSQRVRHIWIHFVSSFSEDQIFLNEVRLFK